MNPLQDACYQELVTQLCEKFTRRDAAVAALQARGNAQEISARAAFCKQKLCAAIAPWQEFAACALTPVCASTVRREGYFIENIRIQVMPDYWVPVSVYVPQGGRHTAPHPAIVVPMGHWPAGKLHADNQTLCANLALQGFVVANYDPMLQGERQPFSAQALQNNFGDLPEDMLAVALHMQPGNQCYLLGRNLASYFLFEGVCVLDYVCTRADVDAARIGVTGQSGGGTQTTYLAAWDERVKAYSPIQCLSKQAVTMPVTGIGDCEQSLVDIHAEEGFEYPDVLWASFPKPVLVSAGEKDFFFLEGVRRLETELHALYAGAGDETGFSVQVAPCAHEISPQTRAFAYAWFARVLQNAPPHAPVPPEQPIVPCTAQELACFAPGQRTKTPLDCNFALLQALRARRDVRPAALRSAMTKLLPVAHDDVTVNILEQTAQETRCLLQTAANRAAFCRVCNTDAPPSAPSNPLLLILSDGAADLTALEAINTPYAVVVPWGMPRSRKANAVYDSETCLYNASVLLGQQLVAQRLNQTVAVMDWLQQKTGCQGFHVMGLGAAGQLAGLLAYFDDRVQRAALCECQLSWDALFGREYYLLPETAIITGVAAVCDLPDLLRAAKAKIIAVNPQDACGRPGQAQGDGWAMVQAQNSVAAALTALQD